MRIARPAGRVRDQVADVGQLCASLTDTVLPDHATALGVPVDPSAGLVQVVFVTPADH
jgi:hypothetical protein